MNTVEIHNVSKRFGPIQAVDDVTFAVQPGEIFGLLGPNGAGKTTTIRMMLNILRPDTGNISVFAGPMNEEKKNRIGYLPEERGLYADNKLLDTVLYLATLKGMSRQQARPVAEEYLRRLDLWEYRDEKLSALSRGMQQKAQFIVTIIHDPDLLIVDEPFSGLDPVNTELIRDILLRQRDAGKTIIMSTHQMHQVEAMCDRIVLIDHGRVVLRGPVMEVRRTFAGNTVEVNGRGPIPDLLDDAVKHAHLHNGSWRLTLADDVTPQQALHVLAANEQVAIEHFSVALPSLHEIFIQVVEDKEPAAADDSQPTAASGLDTTLTP
ncbi:MAG: ATP-binding cassette domain-containing protein [Candidatus Promineifilaceae bacterium]|nr:ATP-binding cassette domain-containing protein [Candidatus Promineifilaceae bacterium]